MKHHVSKSSEEILERRILLLSFFSGAFLAIAELFYVPQSFTHLWMLYTMLLS